MIQWEWSLMPTVVCHCTYGLPLTILFIHFIGDFLLQSDWMALNKGKRWDALLLHTVVYSSCFIWYGSGFVCTTFLLHGLTDAITSRVTSKLWFFHRYISESGGEYYSYEGGNRHWFFVVIGLDQLIHFVCLTYTLRWFQ
jgi:hypothetical protein